MLRLIWLLGAVLTLRSVNILGSPFLNVIFVMTYLVLLRLVGSRSVTSNFNLGSSYIYLLPFVLIMFLSADMPTFESPFTVYSIPRQLLLSIALFYGIRLATIKEGPQVYSMFNKGILWGLIIAAVFILLGAGVISKSGGTRISFLSLNPNVLSMYYVFAIAILLLGDRTDWPKLFHYPLFRALSIILFIYISFSTGSRTGLLAIALILFIWFYRLKMNLFTRSFLVLLVAGLGFSAYSILLKQTNIGSRLQTNDSGNVVAEDSRSKIWEANLLATTQKGSWLFGMGTEEWDHYVTVESGMRHIPRGIHNTYLSLITYVGIAGLLCFVYFLYRCVRLALNVGSKIDGRKYLFIPFLLIILVFSMFHDIYLSPLLWTYAGMLFSTLTINKFKAT